MGKTLKCFNRPSRKQQPQKNLLTTLVIVILIALGSLTSQGFDAVQFGF